MLQVEAPCEPTLYPHSLWQNVVVAKWQALGNNQRRRAEEEEVLCVSFWDIEFEPVLP